MPNDDRPSLRGSGRSELLPADHVPFLESADDESSVDPFFELSVAEAFERIDWDHDPSLILASGRVSVSEFFGDFPWSGDR